MITDPLDDVYRLLASIDPLNTGFIILNPHSNAVVMAVMLTAARKPFGRAARLRDAFRIEPDEFADQLRPSVFRRQRPAVRFQPCMHVVAIVFDCSPFDCPVHPFDLTIGSGVVTGVLSTKVKCAINHNPGCSDEWTYISISIACMQYSYPDLTIF